jgi:hypothetical protein
MPASAILNRKLQQLLKDLFVLHKGSNKLPATIIGAEHREIKKVDHSGKAPNPLCSKLERELVKIAPIGTKGIDNYVGCCCEVRVANQIISIRHSVPIEDIVFTQARRPRTGQKIRRCQNCRQVFG